MYHFQSTVIVTLLGEIPLFLDPGNMCHKKISMKKATQHTDSKPKTDPNRRFNQSQIFVRSKQNNKTMPTQMPTGFFLLIIYP